LPQWNCACANCRAARRGDIPPRTQSSVALSADDDHWFLVNASPDLRTQIESFPPLQPTIAARRATPIQGVFLTNADLDHVLGLFLLREGKRIPAFAPAGVRAALTHDLPLAGLLGSFSGLEWMNASSDFTPLALSTGEPTTLSFRALPLSSTPPPYVTSAATGLQSVAYQFHDSQTGGRVLIAPDVCEITPALQLAMSESGLILFDGTFWSDDELSTLKPGARTSTQMGHLPIREGSLPQLRALSVPRRVYLHINNTNPILAAASRERAETEAAGIGIGEDGQEFTL
jgi:pyrroloquinoline quinone biosynthesis protein B